MRALLLVPALGCSSANLEYQDCATDQGCRDAFGFGYVCGDAGFCDPVELHARCTALPSDLFEDREENKETIVLGHLWRNQSFDIEQRAVELAVIHANDNEGLDGSPYGLVSCDTESLPSVDDLDGETATEEMASYLADQLALPAIVGATSSPETQAAFSITNLAGTLLISPSSTSPALTTLDGLDCSDQEPGLLWRTVPPDELQGQVIAQNLQEREILSIAVIYEEGSYGEGLADAIDDAYVAGTIERIVFSEESDLSNAIVSAGESGVREVVFITSSVDFVGAFLTAAAPLATYKEMPIFLADAAYNQGIYDDLIGSQAEDLFDQIRGTRPTIDENSSVLQTFVASYALEYDGEDATTAGFSAYAYDAGWLAIYGSAWAEYQEGSIQGVNMARGLRQVSSGNPLTIQANSWNNVRALFEQGSSFNLEGTSGQLDFDDKTCETSAPIEIWELVENEDGGWELTTVQVWE